MNSLIFSLTKELFISWVYIWLTFDGIRFYFGEPLVLNGHETYFCYFAALSLLISITKNLTHQTHINQYIECWEYSSSCSSSSSCCCSVTFFPPFAHTTYVFVLMGTYWYLGVILGLFWGYFWVILGLFWCCFGVFFCVFCCCLGVILGLLWCYCVFMHVCNFPQKKSPEKIS